MLAVLVIDHRVAFLFLVLLSLSTAVPLALGWVRVLPEEPLPFGNEKELRRQTSHKSHADELLNKRRDPLAIVLLVCVTLSYTSQLPGVPREVGIGSIPTLIPHNSTGWITFGATWFLVFVPGFAAVYSIIRPNFLRVPLIAAGFLVLLLWLFGPPLHAAVEAVS